MDDLVDDVRKKVEAHPKKTHRKTSIWLGRKAGSPKRNVIFSFETKVRYFDRDDMIFDDIGQTTDEVELKMPIAEMVDGFVWLLTFLQSTSGLFLSQSKFAEEILERAHMQNCNSCWTLVDTESKLGLSYAVIQVYLYMHDPRDPHFTALKRIFCYVRGTLDYGLQLHVSSTTQLSAYTDADWAGCPVTRRSTSGYCVFLGDNLLSWSAKRQVTLSRSSAEAEYRGVVNVVAETAWIRNLLCELHTSLFTATLVYCDNVSVVYMSANPVQHQRTKHIELDIHFVRDFVASGQVRVLHVPSRFQYADIFTNGLPSALFIEFRFSLNVRRPPAHTEGE
ncbi:ribonuclease H-like domain-containing protein [Tanacetum coccineum]